MSPTGHLAIGFAVKKHAPEIPLILLLIAAYAIDLIYFVFIAFGLDRFEYNPWSHSLLMAILWSVSAGMLTLLIGKKARNALVVGLLVFSHWLLDFIVWSNLPVAFDPAHRIGLGLYDKIGFSMTKLSLTSGTLIATGIETVMLIAGVMLYILFLNKRKKENAKTQGGSK